MGSLWTDGNLRPGHLCPFCVGVGAFIHIRQGQIAWYDCRACGTQGGAQVCAPRELRIGAAQGKWLKPYPDPSPSLPETPDRSAN